MFTKHKLVKSFHFSAFRNFAQKSKIIIIGAGTGGITTAKQLVNNGVTNKKDITIFDPSSIHHYQPGWTKIAGIPNKMNLVEKSVFDIKKLLDIKNKRSNYNFQNVAVKEIDPDNNSLIDENGEEWNYDQLIVTCGIKVNHDSIPGI